MIFIALTCDLCSASGKKLLGIYLILIKLPSVCTSGVWLFHCDEQIHLFAFEEQKRK